MVSRTSLNSLSRKQCTGREPEPQVQPVSLVFTVQLAENMPLQNDEVPSGVKYISDKTGFKVLAQQQVIETFFSFIFIQTLSENSLGYSDVTGGTLEVS